MTTCYKLLHATCSAVSVVHQWTM